MVKKLLHDRFLLLTVLLAIAIRLFCLKADWVENLYSTGAYPFISRFLRMLFGWLPLSLGDLLYVAAILYLLVKLVKLFRLLFQKKLRPYLQWPVFRKYLLLLLWVFLIFNLFWGINYYRQGIAQQVRIEVKPYSAAELFSVTQLLEERLNFYAAQVDSVKRLRFNANRELFQQGINDYREAATQYPFLHYASPSIKPSLYGASGKYFGYTGYYNPFTGEAQVKTSIPVFLKNFVLNHELAHQLGYAKEDEASFVSYLVSKNSPDPEVRYSAYYELFFDAVYGLMTPKNFTSAIPLFRNLAPRVKYDRIDERNYQYRNRNFMAPLMSRAYDKYLKVNNQPRGNATYNEVIALVIAYVKKYGAGAI